MEPVARVTVTVTFLRMDRPPPGPSAGLPTEYQVVTVAVADRRRSIAISTTRSAPTTCGGCGAPCRTGSWRCCCAIRRCRSTCCTTAASRPASSNWTARGWPDVNLSYFGLMPHAIGAGVGYPFLRSAVDAAWRQGPRGMTVNTCTADHPRALPTYLRAGFRTAASGARGVERAAAPGDADPERLLT